MIPDLDIYRSANLLVKRHGEDAPIHATMRTDARLQREKGVARCEQGPGQYMLWQIVC